MELWIIRRVSHLKTQQIVHCAYDNVHCSCVTSLSPQVILEICFISNTSHRRKKKVITSEQKFNIYMHKDCTHTHTGKEIGTLIH